MEGLQLCVAAKFPVVIISMTTVMENKKLAREHQGDQSIILYTLL
jgi:hypothetical protein